MQVYVTKLCKAMKDYFIPPVAINYDPKSNTAVILTHGRERILTALFRFTSLLGIIGIASIMENLINKHRWDIIMFYLALAFIICFLSFYRRIAYGVRCFFFLVMAYLLAVVDLIFFGIAEDCRLYLFAFAVLMTIFLGWKSGIAAVIMGALTFIVIAWQISVGNLVITASQMESPVPEMNDIIVFGLTFLMITGIVVSAVAAVMREFEVAWRQERHAMTLLQLKRDQLELRVVERTKELQDKNTKLEAALEDIKTLNGLLPICAQCKKIRDDKGYWNQIESYIERHSDAAFSHGMCPECSDELYGNENWYIKMKKGKDKNK